MTESSAAMNAIKVTAILLLLAGAVALALDGFHYTKNQEDNPGSLEISADMSRQFTVPIWSGVGALTLGGALLMMPMNRKNRIGPNEVAPGKTVTLPTKTVLEERLSDHLRVATEIRLRLESGA